jgi:hypothetical protein
MTYNREYWERHAAMIAEKHGKTVREIVYDELGGVVEWK